MPESAPMKPLVPLVPLVPPLVESAGVGWNPVRVLVLEQATAVRPTATGTASKERRATRERVREDMAGLL
jgi:hypothetical protein